MDHLPNTRKNTTNMINGERLPRSTLVLQPGRNRYEVKGQRRLRGVIRPVNKVASVVTLSKQTCALTSLHFPQVTLIECVV